MRKLRVLNKTRTIEPNTRAKIEQNASKNKEIAENHIEYIPNLKA